MRTHTGESVLFTHEMSGDQTHPPRRDASTHARDTASVRGVAQRDGTQDGVTRSIMAITSLSRRR